MNCFLYANMLYCGKLFLGGGTYSGFEIFCFCMIEAYSFDVNLLGAAVGSQASQLFMI